MRDWTSRIRRPNATLIMQRSTKPVDRGLWTETSPMFSREVLIELYRHMEWADAAVWTAVSKIGDSPDAKLREWLVHIHVVQRAFLHVWTDRPVTEAFRNADDFSSLAKVREWAQPYYPEVHTAIGSFDAARLSEPVVMPWAAQLAQRLGRDPGTPTLAETCFQVTSHSTYHRGQVNARLRELGGEPPLVDYIAWVWFGKPSPAWPT